MLVKICGITNIDDARCVEQSGADFLGCIFVPRSKRYVTRTQAHEIISSLAGRVVPVGVFADHSEQEVLATVGFLGLTMVQLHGSESPAYLDRLAEALPECRFLKAFAFTGEAALAEMRAYYDQLESRQRFFAFLLEGPWGGGTGKPFDWGELAKAIAGDQYKSIKEKLFLAGGLDSQNVQTAVRMIGPMGVDVATGVESRPGKKAANKVNEFVRLAKMDIEDSELEI